MVEIWKTFQEGGGMNYFVLMLGMPALIIGVACCVLAARRSANGRLLGAIALALVVAIAGVGAAGVIWGRVQTDGALEGANVDDAFRERIRAKGYSEAMGCAKFAGAFSVVPLIGGLSAVFAAKRRPVQGRRI
jgi:hypothetical protein